MWQPWATLVAIGEKRVETRSWSTSYRGPLAIHAAKARPPSWAFMRNQHFIDVLEPLVGLNECGVPNIDLLPRGVVLATCDLLDVHTTFEQSAAMDDFVRMGDLPVAVPQRELAFGDFSAGRFAWVLAHIVELPEPYPAVGRQRLWNFNMSQAIAISGARRTPAF